MLSISVQPNYTIILFSCKAIFYVLAKTRVFMLYQVTSSPTCIGLSFPNLNKAIQFLELKFFFHFECIYLFLKVFLYFCSFLLYNVIKDKDKSHITHNNRFRKANPKGAIHENYRCSQLQGRRWQNHNRH